MGLRNTVRYGLLVVAVVIALIVLQWQQNTSPPAAPSGAAVDLDGHDGGAPRLHDSGSSPFSSASPLSSSDDDLTEDSPQLQLAPTSWQYNSITCNETVDASYSAADPTVPRRSVAGMPSHWDLNSSHRYLHDVAMHAPLLGSMSLTDEQLASGGAALKTFVSVRRRSLHAALRRLQGLLDGFGNGGGQRTITVPWARCALLRLWVASGESQALRRLSIKKASSPRTAGVESDQRSVHNLRCSGAWASEAQGAVCAQSIEGTPFDQLVDCLRESVADIGNDDNKAGACATPHQKEAAVLLLQKYYQPAAQNGALLRAHVSQSRVIPRRLQAVPALSADEAVVASFLAARNWTPPCKMPVASIGFAGCGAIHSIRYPSIPTGVLGGRDAPCLDPYSRFHLLPLHEPDNSRKDSSGNSGERRPPVPAEVTSQQWRQLRVLVRMDVEDALEALVTTTQAEGEANARHRRKRSGPPSNGPMVEDAIDCSVVVPWNRLTAMMRRSRWLFDQFVPPFVNESEAFASSPRAGPTTAANDDGGTAVSTHANASLPLPGVDDDEERGARFGVVASRAVLHRVASYKLSQLLAPLHYELTNVCLSPHGFGLSGFGGSSHIPPELRDERRTKIRSITIRRRSTPPVHYVDRPLFLSTVQYQSDNLGHVLYRLGAQQNLLRRAWTSTANAMRVPPNGNPDDYVVGYLVIPNALETFGLTNSLRHFYQLFNQSWLSVAQLRDPADQPSAQEEADEICFRRAWIGHDALYMYHSVGSSPPMRKRYLTSAIGSQAKVEQYFGFLRERMHQCVVAPLLRQNEENEVVASNNNSINNRRQGGVDGSGRVAYNMMLQSLTSATMTSRQLHEASVPIRVLVIQRRQRRLGNLNQLLAALALRFGEVSPPPHDAAGAAAADTSDDRLGGSGRGGSGDAQPTSSFGLRDRRFSNRTMVVTVVDMQDMLMAGQAALVSATDILVGVHGTALQWMLLMRRGSVVVEFQYPSQGCVSSGVLGDGSNPGSRLFCEFGKTSMASHVTHIAYMSADLFGDGARHRLNIVLKRSAFLAVMDAALCALHVGADRSSRYCWRLFPHAGSAEAPPSGG